MIDSERDWKEDFSHENGKYSNYCHACTKYFMGHKRRICCKKCSTKEVKGSGREKLNLYFGLTYASWLTMPRALMSQMPDEWQGLMAKLLDEYEDTYTNWEALGIEGQIGTRVQVTADGKLVKTPVSLLNYRHPDRELIESLKGEQIGE